MKRDAAPVQPMTLGNMRQLGVRSLKVSHSRRAAVLDVSPWPDDVVVPWFGPRTLRGLIGADARLNWKAQSLGPRLRKPHDP